MENTVSGCKFALCLDERLNVEEQPMYIGYKGASSTVYRKQNYTGSIGPNNLHFDITPPARSVVDKRVWLDLEATFNFVAQDETGAAYGIAQIFGDPISIGGVNYLDNGTDGLRCFAFQQCCNSINMSINNISITEQVKEYIEPLSRCGWYDNWINHQGSTAPLMHDTGHNFLPSSGGNAPLLAYKDSQNLKHMPRSHIPVIVVSQTAGVAGGARATAQCIVRWSEPVMLPLLGHTEDEKGFIGVNQMNFEFTFSNLYKMWCSGNSNLVGANRSSTVSATITGASLRMTYLVPPENLALPEINKYPYYGMTRYSSPAKALTVGVQSDDFELSNINLSGIPSRIFVWVAPIASVKENQSSVAPDYNNLAAWAIPDTYASIDYVNLDFNGRSAILTDANKYDLYRIAVKDGQLDMSYPQFSFHTGSVLCIAPESLPLDSLQCSGSRGNVDFQVRVRATSYSTKLSTKQFQLFCIVVDEGVWTATGSGRSYLDITDVSPSNVLEGRVITFSNRLTPGDLQGGVFGFLKKAARGVGKAISWAAKNAPKALDYAKKGVALAEKYGGPAVKVAERVAPLLLGLGYDEAEIEQIMSRKTGAGPWTGGMAETGFSDMSASGLVARGGRAAKKSLRK